MSVDPRALRRSTRSPQQWNRYGYTNGNPLKYVDPDGKETVIFIVESSGAADPKGLAGHAAVFVKSGGASAGVSQFGAHGFGSGVSAFVRGYNSEGRGVTMYVLSTTPEQEGKMLDFIKNNPDGGIDESQSIADQNCTTACVNVLKAGDVVEGDESPGSGMVSLGFDSPKALQQSLEGGDLSGLVTAVIELPAKDEKKDDMEEKKKQRE
jgi:hypothetical protein